MSAGHLQEEANLRARLDFMERDNTRMRRALERAGISPDAVVTQVAEMISMKEHLQKTAELRRSLRRVQDELSQERARNRHLQHLHDQVSERPDASSGQSDADDGSQDRSTRDAQS
jgi:hypothetical protein